MTDKTDHLDQRACGCGTYRKALDEALAEYQRYHDNPELCAGWYLAHVVASATIVTMLMAHETMAGDPQAAIRLARAEQMYGADDTLDYIDAQLEAISAKPEVTN